MPPISAKQVACGLDPALVAEQRWFRHKRRAIRSFEVFDGWPVIRGGSPCGWWLLVRVHFDGESALYQMPVTLSQDERSTLPRLGRILAAGRTIFLADGAADAALVRDLLSRVQKDMSHSPEYGGIERETFDWAGPSAMRVELVSPESSNTVCRLNGTLLFKLYRCLDEAGRREADLLSALGRQRNDRVPAVKAVLTYARRDGPRWALAVVQEWVSQSEDAWRWLVRSLASGPAEVGAEVESMAQSVASVHRGLARIGGRPWTGLDTRKLKRRIRAQVARLLEPRDIPRLVRRDLEAARASIRHIGVGGGGILCPVHGDLHLGQILRSAGRYLVLDFEGEPLAGPEDRLAWHSPLKDVAGMLRSFDYAAAFGRREGAPGSPREWAAWVHQAEGVFLSAYWREMGDVISAATKARDNLLGLYLVEKATYEIAYELQSRPDWVDIPLGGLRRVLARAGPKS